MLIVLVGTSMGFARKIIEKGRFRNFSDKLRTAGVVLVALVGVYVIVSALLA